MVEITRFDDFFYFEADIDVDGLVSSLIDLLEQIFIGGGGIVVGCRTGVSPPVRSTVFVFVSAARSAAITAAISTVVRGRIAAIIDRVIAFFGTFRLIVMFVVATATRLITPRLIFNQHT